MTFLIVLAILSIGFWLIWHSWAEDKRKTPNQNLSASDRNRAFSSIEQTEYLVVNSESNQSNIVSSKDVENEEDEEAFSPLSPPSLQTGFNRIHSDESNSNQSYIPVAEPPTLSELYSSLSLEQGMIYLADCISQNKAAAINSQNLSEYLLAAALQLAEEIPLQPEAIAPSPL